MSTPLTAALLFAVGVLENFLASLNTGFRVRQSRFGCFTTSFLIAITWCYIVGSVSDNVTKIALVLIYSVGYATGDILALNFSEYLDALAKSYGKKIKRWRRNRLQRRKR